MATDVINEVGPGGEFLTHRHTFENFKTEFYAPIMEERGNFDSWSGKGSLSMEQRANAKYKEMLQDYVKPDMDDAVRKNLDKYMESVRNQ